MKKLLLLLPVLITGFIFMTGQKSINNELKPVIYPEMMRMIPDGNYSLLPQKNDNRFSTEARIIKTPKEVYTIYPNFLVHPSFGTQSETPITRHPTNPLIMLASANTYRGATTFSTGVYVTTDGGLTWYGSDTLNNGTFNSGDPGPAIDKDGRFHMSYISTSGNIGMSYSTDNGIVWSANVNIPGSSASSDKNFTTTDDSPVSPYYGRVYTVFTEFGGTNYADVVMSYSTNSGVSWSNEAVVGNALGNNVNQGCDIRVGPNGEVYVVWANQSTVGGALIEDSLGFAKSTNGGVNWAVSRGNASNMNGIRDFNGAFLNGIRANGFPRIAVDRTTGPRSGWIYVSTSEKNIAPATDVSDVILHRSTDGGNTWTKKRVNQDAPGNGKYQYFGTVNVDEQGAVNVVYYDTRNTPTNDSAEVYVSRSFDGGETYNDILVSDHKFKPKSIPGLAAGYQGDYIGITSGNGALWPYWCDDYTGIYQATTAKVNINLTPLNNYNLSSPSAGARIVTYPNYTLNYNFNWDTSTATASYKWIFGNPTASVRKITIPSTLNAISFSSGQLDNILAGLGVAVGDSLVGQWDVWAFRNNVTLDSLKAVNGPRAITLKRGVPVLSAFNLNTPAAGVRYETSAFNFTNINFNWSTSGPGVTYKWKFGSPSIAVVKLIRTSGLSGIDSSFSIPNNELDAALASAGVNPGDSLAGQWSVWAYNGFDSVKATQNNAITFKRKGKGDILVLYDSTNVNCRISRDSVMANLNNLSITYDLYNRKGVTATDAVSFRGYKKVMLLGEGSSVMSNKIKDSLKTYLQSGTGINKSKLIIISEDIGYQIDRSASPYYDSAFARSMCGYQYVADRPGVGGRGITGISINTNLTDSTYGPSSDVIKRSVSLPSSQTFNLYKYRLFADSMNSIGRVSATYNVAVMALDVESIRPANDVPYPFSVKRILNGLIKFVDEIPTGDDPENIATVPVKYSLSQNYPNPFNPSTKINYELPVSNFVTIKVYDLTGKEVVTLISMKQDAGRYSVTLNGADLSSGMYFYKLTSGDYTETRRMILLK